jgi:hypothetical protein
MRVFVFGAALSLGIAQLALATSTDELIITSGVFNATITDYDPITNTGGHCTHTGPALDNGCADLYSIFGLYDTSPAGTIDVSTGVNAKGGPLNFNGWQISNFSGTSDSPGLDPSGLDLGAFVKCVSLAKGACTGVNALTVQFSDVNFNVPVPTGDFSTLLTNTGTGKANSVTQTAYFSNGNGLFGTTTPIGTVTCALTVCVPPSGTVNGGAIAAVSLYSLNIKDVFSGQTTSFSTDGNITATIPTPEPASVVLLSSLAVLIGFVLRRKRSRTAA